MRNALGGQATVRCNYKKLLAIVISAMVVIVGFTSVVRADMGAKPETVITIADITIAKSFL